MRDIIVAVNVYTRNSTDVQRFLMNHDRVFKNKLELIDLLDKNLGSTLNFEISGKYIIFDSVEEFLENLNSSSHIPVTYFFVYKVQLEN